MIELSGSDLGTAVAKEVMGWTEWDGLDDYNGSYPMFCDYDDYFLVWDRDTEDGDFTRSWVGWEDKNDAWEVVEKLRADGWKFCIGDRSSIYGELWAAWFHKRTYGPRVEMESETICEAILRAALAAVREQK